VSIEGGIEELVMNILYITQYFPPDKGAAQIRAWEMVQNLTKMGHRVTVVAEFPNHPLGIIPHRYKFKLFEREIYQGIEVIRTFVKPCPKKNFIGRIIFYLSFMITSILASFKLKRRYDLVYATSSPLFVGLSGYIVSRFKGVRFVFEVRDLWPDAAVVLGELKNRFFIRLASSIEQLYYRKCAKVIVVTKGCYQNVIKKGVDARKIEIVYNGANIETFKPLNEGQELKNKYGYEGKFIVLYAGNFGLIHGMDSLVEAVKLLRQEKDIRFIFIGEGPMKNEVLQSREDYKLVNLQVLNDIPVEGIIDYFNLADVCLVSAKKSQLSHVLLPVKMFDAWSCGKPIILSVDGEAREHLVRAKGGIWVEPENPEQIVNAIRYLHVNPNLCREFGKNGRKYVEEHFSRKVQAERLEKILRDIL
jgi:glycosyltransferase involved in cell wall biosynthesis